MGRNSDAIWHDTKYSLRRDHRWELADLLETTEKERLFREHAETLVEKKRLQFRKLLEETPQITLTMLWKKARKLIKEDPRYKNFGDSDHRRELEYDEYLRDKMVVAKNEFRALLRETKKTTYRSHELIKESEKHYREIIEFLKNDRRFLVLKCVADEREVMLQDHIHDLYRKGPPPHPQLQTLLTD